MSVHEAPATTALIERLCDGHRDRDPAGPLVTIVDHVWAYCAGHGEADHKWRAIEPTTRLAIEEQPAS